MYQVAINWTRQHKGQNVFPIIGATEVSQWEDVMGCLKFELAKEIMAKLEEVSKIELPFPQKFFLEPGTQDVLYGNAKGKMLDSRY